MILQLFEGKVIRNGYEKEMDNEKEGETDDFKDFSNSN
jgi:hypothetical protein